MFPSPMYVSSLRTFAWGMVHVEDHQYSVFGRFIAISESNCEIVHIALIGRFRGYASRYAATSFEAGRPRMCIAEGSGLDTQRLGENFAGVAAHGEQVALFFDAHLFLTHPEVRDMFPVSMATQRDRFLTALGRIVADAGDTGALAPFLRDLGKDHRKFGALAAHYPAVGESLIATLKHFTGAGWTSELEQNWVDAYTV